MNKYFSILLFFFVHPLLQAAPKLERIGISADGKSFTLKSSGKPFVPWGVNYDHDGAGRLLEDYWFSEWQKVVEDFQEIKKLGANVVRIHIQFSKFMEAPGKPNQKSLKQLKRLLSLAQEQSLRIDLTGLGCYHKQDVPAWYDALPEKERWIAQAQFWEAVAKTTANHPALFCYDLMNEPIVRAGPMNSGQWLGPALGDKYFVQYMSDEAKGRKREDIAVEWIRFLKTSIRKHDKHTMITVGLVDWSLDRPRTLYSGFAPRNVGPELDFIAVHLYPETGKLEQQLEVLRAFSVGKPVVIEETFPLKCSIEDFDKFFKMAKGDAAGWMSFYWGKSKQELRGSTDFIDALVLKWLEYFSSMAPAAGQ